MSPHPIAYKAEVSVDFPDKAYMGSFSRHYNSTPTPTRMASPSDWCGRAGIGVRRWSICTMGFWRGSSPNSPGR
jgi:hypothetical protein